MSLKKYVKRLIKFVLYENKQPIVYSNICVNSSNKIHEGKNYFITGGGSGLGFEIAKSLINSGAFVIIGGRNEEKLIKAKNELGDNCEYVKIDVTDVHESEKVLENIFSKYNKLDGIINNAGISLHEENILDVSEENYDMQFNTNLKSSYFLSKKYIKLFQKSKQKNGNIIFISSERGSMCDDIPYGLTKVAINSLTEGLSRRFYKSGIRVNAIAPGVTCSELTKIKKTDDLYSDKAAGRILMPEEIAEVTNFILSDYSKCISGEIINCDAGNHLPHYF